MTPAAAIRKLSTDPSLYQKQIEAESVVQLAIVDAAVHGATETTLRLSIYPEDIALYVIKQLKDRGYNVDHRGLYKVKVSW